MKNNIREIRKKSGLTLEQLAERAGTTFAQIQKLEKGERRLTVEWMNRLGKALHCEPEDFMIKNTVKLKNTLNDDDLRDSEEVLAYMIKAILHLLMQQHITSSKGLDIILNHAETYYKDRHSAAALKVIDGFRMLATDEVSLPERQAIDKLLELVPLGSA